MKVLVLNCGSSSLKAAVVDTAAGTTLATERIERLGTPGARLVGAGVPAVEVHAPDHAAGLALLLGRLAAGGALADVGAVGHRVAHGGEQFVDPVVIDDAVEGAIADLVPLAPLHNPWCLAGIRAARAALPGLPQVAVFDTAFHATLPRRAREYALPRELRERHGLRRYGFHGTSHAYVAGLAARHLGRPVADLRLVTCHLGNGCSVTAVEFGRSVETSMGMTPLEGVPMGTRPGDLDPGLLLHLMRAGGLDVEAMDRLLNSEAGLKGLAGVADMSDIEARAGAGDDDARLAIQVFAHRVRKYIGAYAAVMGGLDAVVFTAGIGENSALIRHRIAQRLDFLGAPLDEDANRDARPGRERPVVEISEPQARVKLLVVATDEESAIAGHAAALLGASGAARDPYAIPVAISVRHVHLTAATVEALFGPGARLEPERPVSQPGQFAARQVVSLVGPRGRLDRVRVVGPERDHDQVEIARTDEFLLGVDAPVRESGDIENTPGIRIEGPAGSVMLRKGVICALRHVHMTPADAEAFGVQNGDIVDVAIDSDGRDLVFGDVLIRVRPDFKLEMHVDTDEGNAAGLSSGDKGIFAPTGRGAHVTRRRPRA